MKNSFLDTSAMGKKILIVVPHEDDEINVAGNIIYSYAKKNAEIFCVFATNGDYSWSAKTRQEEAVRSLRYLGAQHVYFLGYGDTFNKFPGKHFFNAEDEAIVSPAGHEETYGSEKYPDYAFQKHGKHSPYRRESFKRDLQDLILEVKADSIFCVDCDYHCDHRATSILFEEVMGDILRRPGNSYTPLVFKGFAYNTSFNAAPDFYADNILSVVKPENTVDSLIDKSLYEWDKRVRFPVSPKGVSHFLWHNIIYNALFKHASQSAGFHAISVVNGDAVYWQRRTDNLAYQTEVTASSGDVGKVIDFKMVNATDIKTFAFTFDDYLWQPEKNDSSKELTFSWKEPQSISQIVLWGNVDDNGRILSLKLSFDNGYTCEVGPLLAQGKGLKIEVPVQYNVKHCQLQITKAIGESYGISEVGFFACSQQEGTPIFIKLQINGHFAYDYILPKQEQSIQLGLYSYGINLPVKYTIVKGKKSRVDQNGKVYFDANEKELIVRAEIINRPEIYDEISLIHVSDLHLMKQRFLQAFEKRFLDFYLRKYRKYTHIRHKYLKIM